MDLTSRIRFPAEPDLVAELLADPDYVAARCEATGSVDSEIDIEHDGGGGFTVTTTRAFSTQGFPSYLRSLLGDALRIVQEDRWEPVGDGTWVGHSTVTTPHGPAHMSAQARLLPLADGSEQTVDGTIRAKVPLVGAKVEALVHDMVQKALHVEERLAAEWLAR